MYIKEKNFYISDDSNVLFDLNTYRIFCITDTIRKYFESEIYESVDNLSRNEVEVLNSILEIETNDVFDNSECNTVKIHISNACNLKCKYCYANGGNYGEKNSLMDIGVLTKVTEFINSSKKLKNLQAICFFGGEPLLNPKAIEYVCEHTKEKNVKYLLQTNGTIVNDEIIAILKKYNIMITISLDGPKQINDFNRIDLEGNGTYEKILKNIFLLKQNDIIPQAIEATISSNFIGKYSKAEIADFLYEQTGVRRIKVEYDFTATKKLPEEVCEDVEIFFDRCLSGKYIMDNIAFKILHTILSKQYSDFICPAGNETLTIDVHGNIFPCQLFIENKLWNMSNIEEFSSQGTLLCLKKSKRTECCNCSARSTCNICIGMGVRETFCENNKLAQKLVLEILAKYIKDSTFDNLYTNISTLLS